MGKTSAITVNRCLQISDPDVYTVGDCMENRDTISVKIDTLFLQQSFTGKTSHYKLIADRKIGTSTGAQIKCY